MVVCGKLRLSNEGKLRFFRLENFLNLELSARNYILREILSSATEDSFELNSFHLIKCAFKVTAFGWSRLGKNGGEIFQDETNQL